MEQVPPTCQGGVSDIKLKLDDATDIEFNEGEIYAATPSVHPVGQENHSNRRVKRYIHCSDGVYEEFSSDEEGVYPVSNNTSLVDPKTMPWMPWIAHVSSKALAACDYVGETLADFLGITAPKYQYEIEEAKRMQEEAAAEKKATDLEMAGWRNQESSNMSPPREEPQISTPISIISPVVFTQVAHTS